MATELFFDDVVAPPTTLSAAISSPLSTSGTFGVASSTGYSAATGVSQFRCRIDNEYFLVTNVSGTTWTAIGGQEGSTATTHLISAPVTHVLTAGGLGNAWAGFPFQTPKSGAIVSVPMSVGTSNNTNLAVNGTEVMYPVGLVAASTLTAIAMGTDTGGGTGSIVRFGVRSANGTLKTDLGTVTTTSAFATVQLTGLSQSVAPGDLITFTQQGAPSPAATFKAVAGSAAVHTIEADTLANARNGVAGVAYTATGVTGALPSTPTLSVLVASGSNNNPAMGLTF